jgi:hypothetical protein
MYLRRSWIDLLCTWPGSQSRRPAPQRAGTAALVRTRYSPGGDISRGAVARTRSPPTAAPSPPPPHRETRNELKPPAAFRITARRTQLRRPRPGAIGDLNPDNAVPGPDRDRLPESTRAAMPDRIPEDLAHQQSGVLSARVPRAEHPRHEPAGNHSPLRQPSQRHRLPDHHPSHHRTPPFPAAPPRKIRRAAGRTHRDGRPTQRQTLSQDAPRNGHRNPVKRLPKPLPGPGTRPPYVRGHRNTAVYSATR